MALLEARLDHLSDPQPGEAAVETLLWLLKLLLLNR